MNYFRYSNLHDILHLFLRVCLCFQFCVDNTFNVVKCGQPEKVKILKDRKSTYDTRVHLRVRRNDSGEKKDSQQMKRKSNYLGFVVAAATDLL